MKCPNCGANVTKGTCAYCGAWDAPQPTPEPPAREHHHHYYYQPAPEAPRHSVKNRWVALLLCVFLGYLGAHRFYVGKIGTGLLYLFTGGVAGIGWIIDGILILLGESTDKQGRKLKQ